MTERESCIALNLVSGIGAARFRKLTEAFGSASSVMTQSADALARVKGISEELAYKIAAPELRTRLQEELAMAARGRVHMTTPVDPDYPKRLREIVDPPLCLYVRGELPPESMPSVGLVGSRRMSAYGERMARSFATEAVQSGFAVISGLAYGIDFAAHDATVQAGGITVAVLPGGLGRIHPQEHIGLARSIIEQGGAVISECPLTFPVNRQSFPRRNRMVSGLSDAMVVVECGMESGAMITANLALEHNKVLFAVPGQADNLQARGCHYLIKNQSARLAESFADVLTEFEYLPSLSLGGSASEPPEMTEHDALQCTLLDRIASGGATLDELAAETGEDSGSLLAVLMKLELGMKISRGADGKYRSGT